MTLDTQLLTMAAMIISGFYLGMAYDTFRRFKPHWQDNRFLIYFMEIIFWITQIILVFYVLFRVNAGELRFYVFAACLLGVSIYHVLARKAYMHVLEYVIKIIVSIMNFVKGVVQLFIIRPVIFFINIMIAIILFIIHVLTGIFLFLFKLIYVPIKWLFKLIIKLLPASFQNFLHNLAGFYSTMENIVRKGLKFFKKRR